MSKHAKYSPSSAHRWIRCPASLNAESVFPKKDSTYSLEGTAAHSLAAMTLLSKHKTAEHFVGQRCPETDIEFTTGMAEGVQVYVDSIVEYAGGNYLVVEKRVDFSHIIDEPDSFGTMDAGILTSDNKELQAHDLKFGQGVAVYADENEQLMLYALGLYDLMDIIYDLSELETIRLVIHQPRQGRLSEWTCTLEELFEFGRKARAAVLATKANTPMFIPGEKQCEFCRAKGTCKALAKQVMETVIEVEEVDFNDLDMDMDIAASKGNLSSLTNAELANLFSYADLIHDWVQTLRGTISGKLLEGEEIPGYKLVEGREGNRKWVDEKATEDMLKAMRIPKDDMYERSLISPKTAEKLLEKNSPRKWKKLKPLYTRSAGQPSVAPESDGRPALITKSIDDEFEDCNFDDIV